MENFFQKSYWQKQLQDVKYNQAIWRKDDVDADMAPHAIYY